MSASPVCVGKCLPHLCVGKCLSHLCMGKCLPNLRVGKCLPHLCVGKLLSCQIIHCELLIQFVEFLYILNLRQKNIFYIYLLKSIIKTNCE